MLRGFRWQLFALIVAASLFGAGLLYRLSNQPQPDPTPPAQATDPVTVTRSETAIPPTATENPTDNTQAIPQPLPPASVSGSEIVTYREALIGRLQRLNPLLAGLNPVDRDISALIFEGLTRIDEYGQAVPALAEGKWVISNDGREYVFKLREDILWQDGIRFNADDVVYTMSLLSSPDYPGPAEIGQFWQTVETEKLGEFMVRFRLTQPLGSFPSLLTMGILPYHALQGTTAAQIANHPFNLTPIGTGPYQLEAIRTTSGTTPNVIDLRVAPAYRQRPEAQSAYTMERVSFRLYNSLDEVLAALNNGNVDGYAAQDRSERARLFEIREIIPYNGTEPSLGVLIYNWDEGEGNRFFQDQRVRSALATSLDRSTIIQNFMANEAILANSPLLPGSWAYDPDVTWSQSNLEEAFNLMNNANIRRAEATDTESDPATTNDGTLYSFTIMTPQNTSLINIAESIAGQWRQLNLNVNVDAVDEGTFKTRLEAGDFDAAIVELPLGSDPDVYAYWHQGQYPEGKNYGGMSDPRISETLERARREAGGLNRIELYKQFQEDFAARAVALPLYYPIFTYALHNTIDGVQIGFIGSPADRFRTIGDWTFRG